MKNDKPRVEIIVQSIDQILKYTSEGKQAFLESDLVKDAVLYRFQVIGDAIKDLSEEFKLQNPDIEWREITRFRDKVVHHYLWIDYQQVWTPIETRLVELRAQFLDIHQRLVYNVPVDRDKPSKLEERLRTQYSV